MYHVRCIRLPASGTPTQLAAVARLRARSLDRHRPRWQFYLIGELAGARFDLHSKVHHPAVDGAAGVALAQALFDSSPAVRLAVSARALRASRAVRRATHADREVPSPPR